jgi:integrin-linked kinase-associated serine/threonine phosphatase 2C
MKKIFIETYKKIDDTFLIEARREKPPLRDGSTSSTLFILNNTIYSANIGDSQAIVCRKKADNDDLSAIQLTADHSCINFEERSRIQKAGGSVTNGRLLGILEVSRAFGDGQLKAHGLICTPAIKKCTITDLDL